MHDLWFANRFTGWAAAEDWGPDGDRAHGTILITRDGGALWTVQARTDVPLRNLAFSGDLHGLAVGAAGRMLRTADGGAKWTKADAGTVNNLFAAVLPGPTSAWVAGEDGTILAGRPAP